MSALPGDSASDRPVGWETTLGGLQKATLQQRFAEGAQKKKKIFRKLSRLIVGLMDRKWASGT